MLDVGWPVIGKSIVALLALCVDALDGLDYDGVVVVGLHAQSMFRRAAEFSCSDELVLGFGLDPIDESVFSDFEASQERGVDGAVVCVSN